MSTKRKKGTLTTRQRQARAAKAAQTRKRNKSRATREAAKKRQSRIDAFKEMGIVATGGAVILVGVALYTARDILIVYAPYLFWIIVISLLTGLFVFLSRQSGLLEFIKEWRQMEIDRDAPKIHDQRSFFQRLTLAPREYLISDPEIVGGYLSIKNGEVGVLNMLDSQESFELSRGKMIAKAMEKSQRGVRYQAEAKLLSGHYTKPLQRPQRRLESSVDVVDLDEDKTPHGASVSLTEALQQTRRHNVLLGQTVEGEPVTFNLANESGLGIFGKSGTGKSARAGVTFALSAIQQGAHVIVLDRDNNNVWGQLSTHIEHVTDFYGNGDIWGQLHSEFARRQHQLQGETSNYQRRNKRPLRPLIIIFEEYKHFCQSPENKEILAEANALLSTIASQGRKFGMHAVIIAQAPDNKAMPQSVVENLSPLSFYQPSNSGAKRVNLSGLNQLDKTNGEFRYEGELCQAWDTWESDTASILSGLKTPITMELLRPRIDDSAAEGVDFIEGQYRAFSTPKTKKNYRAIENKSERIAAYLQDNGYNGKRKEVAVKLDVDPSYVSRAVKALGL